MTSQQLLHSIGDLTPARTKTHSARLKLQFYLANPVPIKSLACHPLCMARAFAYRSGKNGPQEHSRAENASKEFFGFGLPKMSRSRLWPATCCGKHFQSTGKTKMEL